MTAGYDSSASSTSRSARADSLNSSTSFYSHSYSTEASSVASTSNAIFPIQSENKGKSKRRHDEEDSEDELGSNDEEEQLGSDSADTEDQSTAHTYSNASRKGKEKRQKRLLDALKPDNQQVKFQARLSKMQKQKEMLLPELQKARNDVLAITQSSASLQPNSSSSSIHQIMESLIRHLNAVRTCATSQRYPLSSSSPELSRFSDEGTLQALLAIATQGKLFDPTAFPGILELQSGEVELDGTDDSGIDEDMEMDEEQEKKIPCTFKHYTRCTPLQPIDTLLVKLRQMEEKYPGDYVWIMLQIEDLERLQAAGHSQARIFYCGMTIFSCFGREKQDAEKVKEIATKLGHFKRIFGSLEMFHWIHLDQAEDSKYAFRTDSSLSGIEEVIVDAAGGPLLTMNSQPGGFAQRIAYNHLLQPIQKTLQELRALPKPLYPNLSMPFPTSSISTKAERQARISNVLSALAKYSSLHPESFHGKVAEGAYLEGVSRIASTFELDGDNATRAVIRKDQPVEALTVPNKLYDDLEVGRGARNDKMVDEESQGLIDFEKGTTSTTSTYVDTRYPMLDIWCVTLWHPDDWVIVQIIVLVIWLSILRPRYVIVGASKILGLISRQYFSSIFHSDTKAVESAIAKSFTSDNDRFDSSLMSTLLPHPHHAPYTADDASRTTEVTCTIIWDDLPVECYITLVGHPLVAQLGPGANSFYVTIPVIDGGYHAYNGQYRPYTLQLAQATQLLCDLLHLVTDGLVVDGSQEQAEAVMQQLQILAFQIGLSDAMERIREDALAVMRPTNSLRQLAASIRKEEVQDIATIEAVFMRRSASVSKTQQAVHKRATKMSGAPGSPKRLTQVIQLLQESRNAVNAGNLLGVHPFPSYIEEGPSSLKAFLWMLFDINEGDSLFAAAKGGSKRPTSERTEEERLLAYLKQQQAMIKGQRFRGKESTSVLSQSEAIDWLRAKPNGAGVTQNSVMVMECPNCGNVDLVKNYTSYPPRYRHPCNQKVGTLWDLEKGQAIINDLQQTMSQNNILLSTRPSISKLSYSERLTRFSPQGDATQKWASTEEDPLLQVLVSQIADGEVTVSGLKAGKAVSNDRREKHGRLLRSDMTTSVVFSEKALAAKLAPAETIIPWPWLY